MRTPVTLSLFAVMAAICQMSLGQNVVIQFPKSVAIDPAGVATIHFRDVTPMTIEQAIAQLPDHIPLGEVQADGSVRPGIMIRNDTTRVLVTISKARPVGVVLQPTGEWTIRNGGAQYDDTYFAPGHTEIIPGSEAIALYRTFTLDSEFTFPIHTTIRLRPLESNATYVPIDSLRGFCDPDVNRDGLVDERDVECLVGIIFGGEVFSCAAADFNRDGIADGEDVNAVLSVIAGGDCP